MDLTRNINSIFQIVSNASGILALIHSVENHAGQILIADGSFKKLFDKSRELSPEEKGELLQKTAQQIISAHQELAMEGQTELDGRKKFSINHGSTTPETLLEDVAKVCKDYIAREPNDVNFTKITKCSKS
ncbi:hypothetical protein ILUMI_13806 [Ignelater luminosus]|uniref:UCH catalytic domain-containing protein n=1 Tax=Ignelater luminosus TaxID=2038154 RepID=A0A8K0CW09_IGNLU|nr:hypothetical protein ILUMI_13806 [Ignelater luminosus]